MANDIAWIHVTAFEARTAQDLVAALKTFDANAAPRRIVLDVRNDPGGLVSAAVGVAGAFLPAGDAVVFGAPPCLARARSARARSSVSFR